MQSTRGMANSLPANLGRVTLTTDVMPADSLPPNTTPNSKHNPNKA